MNKLEQRMKLANEAVELIGEIRAEAGKVGHNALREVNKKEEGKIKKKKNIKKKEWEGIRLQPIAMSIFKKAS